MNCTKEISRSVLVFKTDISNTTDLKNVFSALHEEPRIKKWNIDIEDIDNVLRIESDELEPFEIIHLINCCGFYCEELPD
jgi:short-subunit dehydrogenase